MRQALIISKQPQIAKSLAALLRPFHLEQIDLTDSATEARRKISSQDYQLVIINTPLSHEFGTQLALDILDKNGPDVILIVKREMLSQTENRLKDAPCFVITAPVSRTLFVRNVRYMFNARDKRRRLEAQNKKLTKKLDEMKLAFRAKILLMQYLDMTEDQAHRYIQKTAMDTRRTPGEVALSVIDLYENR